jgi:hypothetical protein
MYECQGQWGMRITEVRMWKTEVTQMWVHLCALQVWSMAHGDPTVATNSSEVSLSPSIQHHYVLCYIALTTAVDTALLNSLRIEMNNLLRSNVYSFTSAFGIGWNSAWQFYVDHIRRIHFQLFNKKYIASSGNNSDVYSVDIPFEYFLGTILAEVFRGFP